jgi:V4R domain
MTPRSLIIHAHGQTEVHDPARTNRLSSAYDSIKDVTGALCNALSQPLGIVAERPVCAMNAGYSSGWCEESFGIPLVATEITCRAAGNDTCRFIMAPPWHLEEQLPRHGAAIRSTGGSVSGPEFFQRKCLEEKLACKDKHIDLLAKQIADHEAEIRHLYDEIATSRTG